MTAFSTDTRSSMDACPPLEDLAAFLDGTLSAEERERITAHLASCERCYEVFIGAVQFQEDEVSAVGEDENENENEDVDEGEREVPPSPFAGEAARTGVSFPASPIKEKVRPRASRWLPLAAALLLVPALGYLAWRELIAPPRIVLADVAAPLELEASASDLYEGANYRGESSSARPSFMVGVYLVDLRQSLQAQDVERTRELLRDLSISLQEIPYLPKNVETLAKDYQEEFPGMETSADLARFAPRHPAREAQIQELLSGEDAFQFGLWTEAGRLSARRQSPTFFDDRNNRKFLSHLLEQTPWAGDEDLTNVPGELQAIQQTWDAGELDSSDYTKLEKHFKSIIDAYGEPSDEL